MTRAAGRPMPVARRSVARAVVCASALAWSALGGAQPAPLGAVTVDAAKVSLTVATAVGYAATGGRAVSVLLSDKPANAKSFAEDTRIGAGERYVPGIFEGAWKAQHLSKTLSGVTFTIGPAGQLLSHEFLVGDAFSIDTANLVLEVKTSTPRLTGRIRTRLPVVDAGTKVGLDATFDVAVGEAGGK